MHPVITLQVADIQFDRAPLLADGRIYTAGQAVELGLIDRIASLRETIEATKSESAPRASAWWPINVQAITGPTTTPARRRRRREISTSST